MVFRFDFFIIIDNFVFDDVIDHNVET